jgi:hypothetical protein
VQDFGRERALEATPRLDRSADDNKLRAALSRHARDFLTEQTGARADDFAPHANAVRRGDRRGRVEPIAERAHLVVKARVERQLPLDEERRDEHDARAAVSCEPAREIERVLRLLPLEQRHGDRPITDRPRPARQPPSAATEPPDVDAEPHRST